MTSNKLSLLLAALGFLFFSQKTTAQTCTGNLLQNPGFESSLTNWEGGGTIATDANSGTKALTICAADQPVRQTLAATAGTNYTLAFWGKNGGATMQALGRIKFLNASWMPIGEEFLFVTSTAYTQFTVSKIAPAGAAWVEISVIKSGGGAACAFADDLCLTVGGGGNPQPDLALSNLTINNPTLPQNGTLVFNYDLRNLGTAAAGALFLVKAYFSADNMLSANDIPAGFNAFADLVAGGQFLNLGGNEAMLTPAGNYFLIVKADSENAITEPNEVNNIVTAPFTLTPVNSGCSPDVTPPFFGVGGGGGQSSFSLTTTGTTAVANWVVPSAFDACPGTVTVTSNFSPPATFPLGATTVIYTAKDAANNTATCGFTVTVTQTGGGSCATNLLQNGGFENNLSNWEGAGGVISTTASAGAKSVKLCQHNDLRQTLATTTGKNLTLLFKARTETTGANKVLSYIKYLSASWQPLVTEFFDFSTTAVFTSATVSKIAPTGAAWVEIGFLKQTAACVLVDEVCLSEGGAPNPQPDLTAELTSKNGTNFFTGDVAQLLATAKNIGTAAATGGADAFGFYFSSNNVFDASDIRIPASIATAANLPGGFVEVWDFFGYTLSMTIPGGIPTGQQFVLLVADPLNLVAEANETNNVAAVPLNITPKPSTSCTGDLLINGGFEAGVNAWTVAGGTPFLNGGVNLTTNGASLKQYTTGAAGAIYTAKCRLNATVNAMGNCDFVLRFLNSAKVKIDSAFTNAAAVPTASDFQISKTAPVGTAFVEVALKRNTATVQSTIFVDFICLLGSGGGGTGADLEVTISANKTVAAQWTNVVYTFTAKNPGNATISTAKIQLGGCFNGQIMDFSAPFGLVYASVPGAPTKGTYDFVLKQWTLTNLAAGQSGVLTVTLFTLTTGEQKVVAFCIAQSPVDPDSQPTSTPSSMPNCTAVQDDEAVWTINLGQTLQNGTDRRENEQLGFSQVPDFQIFPNPAGKSVFINLEKWQGKTATIAMFNQLGIKVLEKNFEEISASPETIDLSEISNGQYFLKIGTPGEQPFWGKLVVARMY